jgi:hypothetical protein
MTAGGGREAGERDRENPPEPVYSSVEDWVTSHFLRVYVRPLGGEYRWCAQWWQHAEAITRLMALWHSWESMRLQAGTGMAAWLRDYLDHHLPVLLSRSGPFAHCSEAEHISPREALVEPAPPSWWPGDDSQHDLTTSFGGEGDDKIF